MLTPMRARARFKAASQDSRQAWDDGLGEEITFWRKYFETNGAPWSEDYWRRLDPAAPLQAHVARYLPGHAARLLDVGAGPLTSLGKVVPGVTIDVVAVDALGDVYGQLVDEAGVTPPVRTRQCHSEQLTQLFGAEFDVVHARNCIDHGYDPVGAIREMALVTKPGGVVLLQHYPNEANFDGLHQWDMGVADGRLIVSRPKVPWGTERHDVAVELRELVALESTTDEHDETEMDFVVFRRLGAQ
jgi:SAM-dependent methyltransferase